MKQSNKMDGAIRGSEMVSNAKNIQCDSLTVSNEDSPCIDDFGYNNWYADGCIKAKEIVENNMLCFDIRTN